MTTHLKKHPGRVGTFLFVAIAASGLLVPRAAFAQSVTAGYVSTAVVKEDGTLWTWGGNEDGQLGTGAIEGKETVPVLIGEERWRQVSAGAAHKVAIHVDGTLWSWGDNVNGQLGRNHFVSSATPGKVNNDTDWKAVAAGDYHTLALKNDGSLWAWGAGGFGQLGNGFQQDRSIPVKVAGFSDWVAIAAGADHSLGIRADRSLYAWGSNSAGQLGINDDPWDFGIRTSPKLVSGGGQWKTVAAGTWFSLGIRTDGTLWSWGSNLHGQLGLGTDADSKRTPRHVTGWSSWAEVAAGGTHSLALRSSGSLFAWGNNASGQLGQAMEDPRRPGRVGWSHEWVAIAAGFEHSAAMRSNGVLWTTGANSEGQLGNNSTSTVYTLSASYFGLADLVLTGLTPSGTLVPGQSFTINLFGQNIGSGDVDANTRMEVRLSRTPEWTATNYLANNTFSRTLTLATGDVFNATQSFIFPSSLPSGYYYLGGKVNSNNAISEGDFENNIFWTETAIPFLADLTVDSLNLGSMTVSPGDEVTLSIPVRNLGPGSVPENIDLQVRLSRNRVWGGGDNIVLAHAHQISGLDGNQAKSVEVTATIPDFATFGDYYVGAWIDVDGKIEESDDENNRTWTAIASVSIEAKTIGEAVGQLDHEYDWITGGSGTWFAQEVVTSGQSDIAAQSPPLAVDQSAWFETKAKGPTIVRFNWKAESHSQDNYLIVTLDGQEKGRIYGSVDWEEFEFLAPASVNEIRWTYVKQTPTDGTDAVWVADIEFEEVTQPDIVVTDIFHEGGTFVLQRDTITIQAHGKNQGTVIPGGLPDGYRLEVRLSPVRNWEEPDEDGNLLDNIHLGYLTKLKDLGEDNHFVYQATLDFQNSAAIPAGEYYIGVQAPVLLDEHGEPNELFVENNTRWTSSRSVTIKRRPDLRVTDLVYEPGIFTINSPGPKDEDELELSFKLRNDGLANVPANRFKVRVVLSPDRDLNNGNESILIDFNVDNGFFVGQTRTYTVVTNIPEGTAVGSFQYVGVIVDVDNDIAESREDNNTAVSSHRDVFIQDLPIGIAVHLDEVDWETGNSVANPPWYGQKEIFYSTQEPRGAARAAKNMRQGDRAEMTTLVQGPAPISFFWKVDSEERRDPGTDVILARNYMAFYVDDQRVARISGDVDWNQMTFNLPESRQYKLTWAYVKELDSSGGADTGWVDQITRSAPNLVMESLDIFPSEKGYFEPGDQLTYRAVIRNSGQLPIPLTPSYSLQVRLSKTNEPWNENMNWTQTQAGEVILETYVLPQEDRALAPGASLTIEREVDISDQMGEIGDFYAGAWIDFTNRITESDYGDNLRWTVSRVVRLEPTLGLSSVLGFVPSHVAGWQTGGSGSWFGQTGEFHEDPALEGLSGYGSAAQSPTIAINQKAWFEAEVEGPSVMSFSWKVNSREGFNFLRLYVSGEQVKEISGDTDWARESVFIPVGPQTIRFSYEKTSNAGVDDLDTSWVDAISFEPVDKPDLLITSVNYSPGAYVLERDRLTLTIVAENRGLQTQAIVDSFGTVDLDLRLSNNRIPGEGEEFFLGNFAPVQVFAPVDPFTSGAVLVFSADIALPLDIPEGYYYLIAKVDSHNQVEEFVFDPEVDNNTWITVSNDIRIRRLPHLIPDNFTFDSSKAYFPYGPMEIDWVLRNRGLGNVTGEVPYIQEIRLMALSRGSSDMTDAEHVATLSSFSDSAYLPGVSASHPFGSGRTIFSRVTLPSPAALLYGLGEISELHEEGHVEVIANTYKIFHDYFYYLAIVTDATHAIEQSSDLRVMHFFSSAFDIYYPDYNPDPGNIDPDTYEWWTALYPGLEGADPMASYSGDGVPNLLKYALNLNPSVFYPGATSLFSENGRVLVAGEEYFRMTFNIVKAATDIRYIVEVSEDMNTWAPLVTLQPPYTAETGPQSLTGNNGLISNDRVLSASDQGFTAAVSVIDEMPVSEVPGARLFRLRIETVD